MLRIGLQMIGNNNCDCFEVKLKRKKRKKERKKGQDL
jgi:hypothetical protein